MFTQAQQSIVLARKHVGNGAQMESSARLCLADAVAAFDRGEFVKAGERALKSLAYSVGIFALDYQKVRAMVATMAAEAANARR